jgi:hypothetical protein
VTTDIDRETAEARERLANTLVWAAQHGLAAHGEIGDPIDPLAGLADEMRSHSIDEILVTEHPAGQANWVEATIIDALHRQIRTPIKELVTSSDAPLPGATRGHGPGRQSGTGAPVR